ncbi:DNA-binding protein [Niallia taxi]|uniref:DNA-binding protein n=1 Tax=Niallia taxi TaxID=2499688 RepID=UPI002E2508C3|nr:DNA-binding protein [Niallia taxi]
MEFNLKGRRSVEDFFTTEILGASEACELLDIGKQRLSQLKTEGRLIPIKALPRENLFLREEVLKLKEELAEIRKIKGTGPKK